MAKTLPWEITINPEWCKKCGLCVEFCPHEVLEMKEFPHVKNLANCIGCLMCEMHCPDFAIIVRRREEND